MPDTSTGRRPTDNPAPTLQRMEMLFLMGLTSLDGVFPVIPSEVAVLAAGVIAHNLLFVILAAAVGVFIGDHLAYGLARSVVGPRLIGRFKRVSRAVDAATPHLDRRAPLLIVASRFLPGGRVSMNLACGTARVPLSRFTPASAVAALAWATYIASLGHLGGATFAENPLLGIAVGLGLSFVLGGVIELVRRRAGRGKAGTAQRVRPALPALSRRTSTSPRRRPSRRKVMTATAALAAVAAVGAVPAAGVAAPVAVRGGLQEQVDGVVAAGAVGALAEVRDGRGTWRGTSGVAELGTTRPVPVAGRFRAGSVTKTFLATVVLQLADEGRLRLDDPAETWLPGTGPFTVRQLLNHTSGVYDYLQTLSLPPNPAFLDNRWRTWTPTELANRGLAHPPTFEPPGSAFAYSNTGYVLLGQIVEKVTGHSYAEEIECRILRPLRLRDTSLPGTSPWIPGPHPHGYVPIEGRGLVDVTAMNPSVMGAGGELISSTADLNVFFAALLGGRLLPDDLLAEMRTQGVAGGRMYGLGLAWRDTPCGVRVYGNDGDALAYQAWSFATKNRQVTVALTPTFEGDTDTAVAALLNKAFCG